MADRQAVVIVEDPDEAQFLIRLLDHAGIQAAPMVSTAAALAAVKGGEAGSVVIAMSIGRESGLEMVEQVRKLDSTDAAQVPIVVLAQSSKPVDRLRAWERGADTFLTKPFHFDELVDALETTAAVAPAERSRRRRQLFETERKRIAQERRR